MLSMMNNPNRISVRQEERETIQQDLSEKIQTIESLQSLHDKKVQEVHKLEIN